MAVTSKHQQDESHKFYQRLVLCKRRGGSYPTHRYTLPFNITQEELRVFLLEKEGTSFNTEELMTTGELLTAHHKLTTDTVANMGIRRTPIEDIQFYLLLGLKYLLGKGVNYKKAVNIMRDYSTITEQDEIEFWKILTDKDFLEKVERMAYSS